MASDRFEEGTDVYHPARVNIREDPWVAGGPIMAMSLVSVTPDRLPVFFGLQKYFIQGGD